MGELGERGRAPTLKANQADSCIDLRPDKPPISLTSGSLVVLRTLARDQGGGFCGVEGQKHTGAADRVSGGRKTNPINKHGR